jgi:hypothetical protein
MAMDVDVEALPSQTCLRGKPGRRPGVTRVGVFPILRESRMGSDLVAGVDQSTPKGPPPRCRSGRPGSRRTTASRRTERQALSSPLPGKGERAAPFA